MAGRTEIKRDIEKTNFSKGYKRKKVVKRQWSATFWMNAAQNFLALEYTKSWLKKKS